MRVKYTIEAIIEVPDGSRLLDHEDDEPFSFHIELPTGERVRVEDTIYQTTMGDDHAESEHLGSFVEELGIEIVEGALLGVEVVS